ncbi:hypothetical protein C2G38_2207101 [Gigaspora rosea]|uniref:Serine-threonine/tyrosine-protein kinase catalytic domain-containing protein n=1 Tax=Gigaspora rosea TaxID=44941 RepID=A0A397UIM9_9GLOM|nr:hypothetical protein C2G38_2207101 [Gigaspora rosea]
MISATPFTVKANVGWSDCSFNAIDAPITALPRTRSTTRKPIYTSSRYICIWFFLTPDISEHVPNFIKEIINNCWKHEPQERPKADYLNEVLYRLELPAVIGFNKLYWLDFYEKKDNEITRECKKSDDKAKVLADSNASF